MKLALLISIVFLLPILILPAVFSVCDPMDYSNSECYSDAKNLDLTKVPDNKIPELDSKLIHDNYDKLSSGQRKSMAVDQIRACFDKISDLANDVDKNKATWALRKETGALVDLQSGANYKNGVLSANTGKKDWVPLKDKQNVMVGHDGVITLINDKEPPLEGTYTLYSSNNGKEIKLPDGTSINLKGKLSHGGEGFGAESFYVKSGESAEINGVSVIKPKNDFQIVFKKEPMPAISEQSISPETLVFYNDNKIAARSKGVDLEFPNIWDKQTLKTRFQLGQSGEKDGIMTAGLDKKNTYKYIQGSLWVSSKNLLTVDGKTYAKVKQNRQKSADFTFDFNIPVEPKIREMAGNGKTVEDAIKLLWPGKNFETVQANADAAGLSAQDLMLYRNLKMGRYGMSDKDILLSDYLNIKDGSIEFDESGGTYYTRGDNNARTSVRSKYSHAEYVQDKAGDNLPQFLDVCSRVGADPGYLTALIDHESKWDPEAVNDARFKKGKGSLEPTYATGLIQFMPLTVSQLLDLPPPKNEEQKIMYSDIMASLPISKQLELTEEFFLAVKKSYPLADFRKAEDIALATFYPEALNYANNQAIGLSKEKGGTGKQLNIYLQNKNLLDPEGTGIITKQAYGKLLAKQLLSGSSIASLQKTKK